MHSSNIGLLINRVSYDRFKSVQVVFSHINVLVRFSCLFNSFLAHVVIIIAGI